MAPARRSLGNVATPSPLVPAGERKPRRSFFTSLTKLPLVLPQATTTTSPAPKASMISLAEFAPPPDFVQSALLPPTSSAGQDVPQVSASGPRIKEVVSFRVSRRKVAAAEATAQEKIRLEEREESSSSAADLIAAQPRASRSSTRRDSQRLPTPQEVVPIPSSPSHAPVDVPIPAQAEIDAVATRPSRTKEFLQAGLYCQDADASPSPLITDLLAKKSKGRGKAKSQTTSTFPPLPIEHGVVTFLNRQNDFVLPYNIVRDFENGRLGAKKVPEKYTKLRGNVFPERQRRPAPETAVCHCEPLSECRVQCINKAMSYFCGKDCPSGDACANKSLTKRKGKATKVAYTGLRGFGLVAAEEIKEGDFVIDYRGEVISLKLFYQRIREEYKDKRNFYALAYDSDEVIDSGMRGNDARFINHGCAPNLEVRKYTTMGDGVEEYEVGFWAARDIKEGEELMYDYNFDSFSTIQRDPKNPDFVAPDEERRTRCNCGAAHCVGYLGKKSSSSKSASSTEEDDSKMDIDFEEVEEAVLEPLKPAARQPRIPVELLKSRKLFNSEPLKLSGSHRHPLQLKASKPQVARKGLIVKNGTLQQKAGDSRSVKTRSRISDIKPNASGALAASVDGKVQIRQAGLLSVAKKAIAKTSDMDVEEARRMLEMSEKDWELERKRLKKGHDWKARQIAAARELISGMGSISPEKRRSSGNDTAKDGQQKTEKSSRPTPTVLLDPSHCFRPDSWSSIKPQPVSPEQAFKSRVTLSDLLTAPYRRLSRSSQDRPVSTSADDSAKATTSTPQSSKVKITKPSAREVTPRAHPYRKQPVRTSVPKSIDGKGKTAGAAPTSKVTLDKKGSNVSKRLMGRSSIAVHDAVAKNPGVPIVADSASDMMLGKSKSKFISDKNNNFVDVETGQVRKVVPPNVNLYAVAVAEPEERLKSRTKKADASKAAPPPPPLTSRTWAPPVSGPRLKFRRPSQLPDIEMAAGPSHPTEVSGDYSDCPPLPSAAVKLPPPNITELPQNLLHFVETRVSKRRSALETERFSQGKGSAWFQAEAEKVKEEEYSRAFAFVRQQHVLSNAQHQLEAMTAEFASASSKEASPTQVDLNAFVSPPTPVAGNKRRSGSDLEYQTRKKPGTIRKTEAEWEEERRTRKKGLDWLRVMQNIHGVAPGGPVPKRTYRQIVISRPDAETNGSSSGKKKQGNQSPTRFAPWTPISASSSTSSSARKADDNDSAPSKPEGQGLDSRALNAQDDDRWDNGRLPQEPVSVHYQKI